jgi:hypothetical protein
MFDFNDWRYFAPILLLVGVLVWMLYFPRTNYENRNRFLSGEDYWNPFRSHSGPRFSRGPRLWRRIPKLFLSAGDFLRSDAGLEAAMRKSLQAKGLPWREVVVQASDGRVWLYGTVSSEAQKRKIEAVAKECPGVLKVESFLRVFLAPDAQRAASN